MSLLGGNTGRIRSNSQTDNRNLRSLTRGGKLARGMASIAIAGLAGGLGPKPEAGRLKPLMSGLISMGPIGFHRRDDGVPTNSIDAIAAEPGVFRGIVINVTWAQLQPTPGSLDTTAIDEALAGVRAYNAKNPMTPLAVDLRVWPGPNAPAWVKALDGPPVEIRRIYPRQPLQTITIGRFWSASYSARWIALQTALAKKYDSDPLIVEVSDTSCASYTDEPFVIAADPVSLANMQSAGFSDATFRACLERSPSDFEAWRTTRLQVAVNPFRRTDQGRPTLAYDVTQEIVVNMRHRYGAKIILSNHALRATPLRWIVPVNDLISRLGPPIEMQTDSPKNPDGLDWEGSIQSAANLGAEAVEVWSGRDVEGFETKPAEDLKRWSVMLTERSGHN
jgi:hypothetical protein